ncbi:MAG: right-handed parallel beta-helix repeat-containing protein [Candidatus Cloacimonetes bacterium]|nr:right-handed parallel beta-helix repeat-containing protein [Candidatus Cloacimonadota bacterium]
MKKIFIVVFFLGLIIQSLISDTPHNSDITSDETWYPEGNPHIIPVTISVNNGVTLTIQAGCEIRLDSSKSLNVYGTLLANGAAGDSITFTRNSTSNWSQLYFTSNSHGTFSYCTIELGTYLIFCNNATSLSIDHCRLSNGNNGMRVSTTNAVLSNSRFLNNTTGIYLNSITSPVVGTNNYFSGNTTAIDINNSSDPQIHLQQGLENNSKGIRIFNCSNPQIAAGNTITGGTDYGVYFEDCTGLGTLDNLVVTDNAGFGAFYILNSGLFTLGSGNTITGNEWPLSIDVGSFPHSSSNIPTSGNDNNDIRVSGSGSSNKTGIWPNFADLDYIVTESTAVGTGGFLTISVGDTIRFRNNKNISVYGRMNAIGTASDPIIFTADTGVSSWGYLRFLTDSDGIMQYCHIDKASYAIYPNSCDTLIVDNCYLFNNTYAMYINSCTPIITNNTITDNTSTGIHFNTCSSPQVGVNNDVSDNVTAVYFTACTSPYVDLNQPFTGNDNGIYFFNCTNPQVSAGNYFTDNAYYGLRYENCDGLGTIDNLILTGNQDYGAFLIENSGDFTLGPANTINGNAWPLTIDTGSFPDSSSYIPLTGSTYNDIRVTDGFSTKTGIWPNFAILDYVVTETPSIGDIGALTISAGDTLRFRLNKNINVYGRLNALGTSSEPIIFTADTGVSYWAHIRYHSESDGILQYCIMDQANYAIYPNSCDTLIIDHCQLFDNNHGIFATSCNPIITNNEIWENETGIYFNSSNSPQVDENNHIYNNNIAIHFNSCSSPGIALNQPVTGNNYGVYFQNCTSPQISAGNSITDNNNCGIRFENCSGLGLIDDLVITGNQDYGAFLIKNSGYFTLGSGNTINGSSWPLTINMGSFPDASSVIPTTGSTRNDIRVTDGNGDKIGTWPKFSSLDYVVTESPGISASGKLTIAAGNTLRFYSNKNVSVYGRLDAIGTSSEPIIFTADTDVSYWAHIRYLSDSDGILQYCHMDQGNYTIYPASCDTLIIDNCQLFNSNYGVYMTSCNPVITNTSCINNDYGIYCNDSSPVIHSCSIVGNTNRGLYLNGNCIPDLGAVPAEGNTIYDNGNYDIYNGTEDISALYIYWGTENIFLIGNLIYDHADDEDLGTVTYIPWSDAAHTWGLLQATSPNNLHIVEADGEIQLSWDPSPDAFYYQVYYASDPNILLEQWQLQATGIFATSWSEFPTPEKKFYFLLGIKQE